MITNPHIIQVIEEVFNERIEQEIDELENEEPHSFSKKHKKRMIRMIKDQKKPYFKLICTSGRRAACIIVTLIVLSVSALSIKAIREAVFDFITKNFSDHTIVTIESGTDSGYPETIEEEYYISELPEGFEMVDYDRTNISIDKTYINGDMYIVFCQATKVHYSEIYDNENTVFTKYIDNNNQEYLVVENEYDKTYIWDNGKYVFIITSNLDKDTILKMCKTTIF